MKRVKYIAIVTARKNSEKVKNKNLKIINKKFITVYNSKIKKKIQFGATRSNSTSEDIRTCN